MSFVHEDTELQQLLGIVARETGITAALIEKDYWVTRRAEPNTSAAGIADCGCQGCAHPIDSNGVLLFGTGCRRANLSTTAEAEMSDEVLATKEIAGLLKS